MESVTEEDVINACHMACLDDFINEQPLGLATFVDENGMNFSAGQKQAIAIARALIRKPSLLILDEATSNIDWEKENQIIERIMNLDIPCIWITHNPKIIEKADAIVDISGGLYE